MLSLSKRTEYALIALAYLAARPGQTVSAREVAAAHDLPLALLMNILKELHQGGVVRGIRGTKGGYQLAADAAGLSLHDLIVTLEGPVRLVECVGTDAAEPCGCDATAHADEADACRVKDKCSVQAPLTALHHRLIQFLKDVKLSDVIRPGAGVVVTVDQLRAGVARS